MYRIGWNIACVCIIALLCITAVACTALASGHDGLLASAAFTLLGAIPAGVAVKIKKDRDNKKAAGNDSSIPFYERGSQWMQGRK